PLHLLSIEGIQRNDVALRITCATHGIHVSIACIHHVVIVPPQLDSCATVGTHSFSNLRMGVTHGARSLSYLRACAHDGWHAHFWRTHLQPTGLLPADYDVRTSDSSP